MASIDWDLIAIAELESLRLNAARDSVTNSENLVSNIVTTVGRLADFPLSGRIVPEFNDPEIREIIVGRTRVVYAFQSDVVTIHRVNDGSRPLRRSDFPL